VQRLDGVATNTLADFLNGLGGLHDATVVSINWQASAKTLEFAFDDLYANFRGMPEYPGRRTGVIRLHGLSQLSIDVESSERLRVFEFLPDEQELDVVLVKFSLGGHVSAKYALADHPANELLQAS
jgi:hypothetical protein